MCAEQSDYVAGKTIPAMLQLKKKGEKAIPPPLQKWGYPCRMMMKFIHIVIGKVKGAGCISLTFIVLMLFTVVFSGCGNTSTNNVKQMDLTTGTQQVSPAAQT